MAQSCHLVGVACDGGLLNVGLTISHPPPDVFVSTSFKQVLVDPLKSTCPLLDACKIPGAPCSESAISPSLITSATLLPNPEKVVPLLHKSGYLCLEGNQPLLRLGHLVDPLGVVLLRFFFLTFRNILAGPATSLIWALFRRLPPLLRGLLPI